MIIEQHDHWAHFHSRFVEWLITYFLLGWGGYILYHPGLFQDPRVAAVWMGMLAQAAQPVWATGTLLVGTIRLCALYVNGRHTRTPLFRLLMSFASAFLWTQVFLGMVKGGAPNPGLVLYAGMIVADIYSAFKASQDVTFVSRRQRAVKAEIKRVSSGIRSS